MTWKSGGDVVDVGNVSKEQVTDTNQEELLSQILLELRILNAHQAAITDQVITEDDLEEK